VARVVVVGGGFGGLATAARLAKLGHEVTVLERLDTLGGAMSTVAADGFEWDAGPTSTLLPAVIRDLFRKSGRPVERELDIEPLDLVREHWFEDGTVLGLPGHSRAAQLRAFDELGPGLGQR
jgi:phytoene dehydrogenase-like protein